MAKPDKGADISKNELDGIDLEKTNMDLGSNFLLTEGLGMERYRAVAQYHQLNYDVRANRGVGNHQQAEQLNKQLAALRAKVALIDKECPGARKVHHRLMHEEESRIKARAAEEA